MQIRILFNKIFRLFLISFLIVGICLYCFAGCQCSGSSGNQNSETNKKSKLTDIDLVKNGKTEYVIVVPFNSNNYETYAAQEMQLYFKKSTGADIPIINDTSVVYDENNKHLSIGQTLLLQQSGVKVSFSELGSDGYKIVRKGNSVILAGGGNYGTLYSVYEFLHQTFGWEPYAIDEIYYNVGLNFKLPDFSFTDIPASATRAGEWYYNYYDANFAAKWRTFRGAEYMMFNERVWYFFPHSTFRILPTQTYLDEHPDWYAESKAQLCLSNEEAKAQFVENLKAVIVNNPSLRYIPFGMEDDKSVCTCEKCQSEQGLYKVSGQLVRWVNDVVSKIQKWLKEEQIERELYFPMLAYYKTEEPPTKNGKPIDDSCILNRKSPVIFAPIAASRQYPLMDEEHNAAYRNNLLGWEECSETIMFYLYNDHTYIAFEWYDTWEKMVEDLKLAGQMKSLFTLIDNEGQLKQARAFQVMEGYVHTKLMWNPNVDVNALIDDFIIHYYKEAATYISEYYYSMKMYYRSFVDDYNLSHNDREMTNITPDPLSYNRVFMEQTLDILDKAHNAIENADYTREEKEIYHKRITIESFTQRFLLLDNFSDQYTTEEYLKMVDDFERDVQVCGIQQVNGKYAQCLTNEQQFAVWRQKKGK